MALSNAHRSELIVPMFAHGGMYRSSNVGEFEGGKAIVGGVLGATIYRLISSEQGDK